MRAVVFAYHNMGIAGIRALLDHGFTIPMVLSHEDDPKENRWFGSVADFCRSRGIPVFTPADVNSAPWPDRIRTAAPDLLFSFYYRSMLKKEVLGIPRLGGLDRAPPPVRAPGRSRTSRERGSRCGGRSLYGGRRGAPCLRGRSACRADRRTRWRGGAGRRLPHRGGAAAGRGGGGGDRRPARRRREREVFMKVLILGVNGFIGHHLTARILKETDWMVYGMDLSAERLGKLASHPRFDFVEGDISINKEWIEYQTKKADIVLPLVAIATPKGCVQRARP